MKIIHDGLENFNCKKVLISMPVSEAIKKAGPRLEDLFAELSPADKVILYPSITSYKHVKIERDEDNIYCEVKSYYYENKLLEHHFTIYVQFIISEKKLIKKSNIPEYLLKQFPKESNDLKDFMVWGLYEECFLQFAELEVKELKPSRQIYEGVNCLYNNKTKSDIQIIDSTWFTTLVKSDEFKVRGHFRLQPCGEGMAKRKLIWVSEFKKSGYTREAKKIKEFPTI